MACSAIGPGGPVDALACAQNCTLRDAVFVLAVERLTKVYAARGIFP